MVIPKWISWAGLSAVIGGVLAIALTPPFAVAYFQAYPGYDIPPFWLEPVKELLEPLLSFSDSISVYNTYGRVYEIVYLLFLPAVFALHKLHQPANSRAERLGFYVQVAALVATFIGVAGDYWADGITFLLSVVGLLVLSIGTTVYGFALLRSKVLPLWCAWLFVAGVPLLFISLFLIGHIPSGPTFPFAVLWLIVGCMLAVKRGHRSTQAFNTEPSLIEQRGKS